MPRTTYVNKRFTLTPGDTLTTYQYEPSLTFYVGFRFVGKDSVPTTPNSKILIELFGSNEIGGARTLLKSYTFSTNVADNINNPYFDNEKNPETPIILMGSAPIKSLPYLNGRYTNKSSHSVDLNVLITMD